MKNETVILHSDLNCYYASVEMNEHPELKGKKIAVCGSTENRHGMPAPLKTLLDRTMPLSSIAMRKVGDRYEHVGQADFPACGI